MKTARTSRAKSPAKAAAKTAASKRVPRKATAARVPAAASSTGAVIRSATQRKSPRLRESLQSVAAATVKQPGKLAVAIDEHGEPQLIVFGELGDFGRLVGRIGPYPQQLDWRVLLLPIVAEAIELRHVSF